tara:strand:+ start:3416 stop:4015 length:600 start_codon:yes stop_codon:yes gene_type:complete
MEIIAHKINSIKSLRKLPSKYGSEVDLRTFGSRIVLSHDPYKKGDRFEDYLENYNHGTLILNIKESGIENEVIKKVRNNKISNFFLLDVEMPFICVNKKELNKFTSIRFSEYESIDTLRKFKKKVGWVWIDTFKNLPIKKKNLKILKDFKSCLVCPERWNRPKDINKYFFLMKKINFLPNCVMTNLKYAKKWERLISNY